MTIARCQNSSSLMKDEITASCDGFVFCCLPLLLLQAINLSGGAC
jgi:hypothetical protein